jgi:hypothetical protein
VHKFVCILLTPFLKDSAAEQQSDSKPPKFILDATSLINSSESENKSDRKKVKKTPKYVEVGKFLIGWCINLFVFF